MAEATSGSLIGCSGKGLLFCMHHYQTVHWDLGGECFALYKVKDRLTAPRPGSGPGRDRPRLRTGVICAPDRVAPTSPPKRRHLKTRVRSRVRRSTTHGRGPTITVDHGTEFQSRARRLGVSTGRPAQCHAPVKALKTRSSRHSPDGFATSV